MLSIVEDRVMEATGQVSSRILELDGLRAVAIALVVAYHFDLHVRGGFIGVDLFFVISGLVITRGLLGQLMRVGDSGVLIGRRQLLADFYLRRTWRLMPSLTVMLAVVVVAAKLFPGPDLDYTTKNAIAGFSGFANWWVRSTATRQGAGALTHTWSLAIEEQFYLVLPLVLAVGRRFAERIAVALSGVLISISIWVFATMTFDLKGYNEVYFSSFGRSTPIALGVVLGVWCHRQNRAHKPAHQAPISAVKHQAVQLMLVLMLVSLVPVLAVADFNSRWLYRGGFHALSVLLAAIVALTVVLAGSNNLMARLLRSRPALTIGNRSYSLYLTHFPLVYRFDSYGRLGGLVMKLAATLLATELLYRCVETPLRKRGPKMRRGSFLVAVQALVVLASVGYLVS